MNARAHAVGVALLALVGAASRAEAAPAEFYAGKTISIITSGGGGYEAYESEGGYGGGHRRHARRGGGGYAGIDRDGYLTWPGKTED